MKIRNLIPALLLAVTMSAAPAFAANEVAGIVQSNSGNTIFIGSQGRQFAASADSVFLVNGQRVNPYYLQPGTPVQVYRGSSLTEVGSPYYGGYRYHPNYDRYYDRDTWYRR